MPVYYSPGIYVEEVSTGARPIQAVGTSTAGFVGESPNPEAHLDEAFPIINWEQFRREYIRSGDASTPLSNAVFGFFENGGRRCYVVNVGRDTPIDGDGRRILGLRRLEAIDEVAMIAAPGRTDVPTYESLISQAERLMDRVAILDPPEGVDSIDQLTQVGLAESPDVKRRKPKEGEPADTGKPTDTGPRAETVGVRPRSSKYAILYYPWIYGRDPLNPKELILMPPSGHMAGIYARTDANRGVHNAPANTNVKGAVNLAYRVTKAEQEILNPKGVNCIRFFPDRGIQVWGARTLSDDPEWIYVNVRRLFMMVEESIGRSTSWVVFEPNGPSLWKDIRRDVGAFLELLWRDGALLGRTREEAFFVKCDEETNPREGIDQGIVTTIVGMAPVKPAEFVVFRIGQKPGGSEVEEQTGGGGAGA